MWNLYKADMHRIYRHSFKILLSIVAAVGFAVFLWFYSRENTTSTSYLKGMDYGMMLVAICYPIIDYIIIMSTDFRAKTMQTAIGSGISRRHIVLCKMAEIATAYLIDLILIGIVTQAVSMIRHIGLDSEQRAAIVIMIIVSLLLECGYLYIAMIPTFYMQNSSIGLFLFLVLHCSLVDSLINLLSLSKWKWLANLHLNTYLLTEVAARFKTHLLVGTFSPGLLLGIAVWIAIAYAAASFLFSKKELDF